MVMEPIYVYRHRRLDDHQVFYVGIGIKKRPYDKKSRNRIWHSIVKKHGYYVEIIQQVDSWELACELEKSLISLYGRIDNETGTLANMTDGGDGTLGKKMTSENLKKLIEISKLRKGKKGQPKTQEQKNHLSDFWKGKRTGENATTSKLTTEQVAYIKSNYVSGSREFGQGALAKKFNISRGQIYNIVHNMQWTHI